MSRFRAARLELRPASADDRGTRWSAVRTVVIADAARAGRSFRTFAAFPGPRDCQNVHFIGRE
jgi:hypothetical protein